MYYSTTYPSPVGLLTLACDLTGSKLVGVWLEGQKYHGNTIMDGMTEKSGMPVFDRTKDWLDRYFDGEKPPLSTMLIMDAATIVWDTDFFRIPKGRARRLMPQSRTPSRRIPGTASAAICREICWGTMFFQLLIRVTDTI